MTDQDETDGDRNPARAQAVLEYVTQALVDDPDAVSVDTDLRRDRVDLRVHVAPDDVGKVIGRRGRVVQAIRTVVRATAARDGLDADVDVVD